jgi:hypothetical protein
MKQTVAVLFVFCLSLPAFAAKDHDHTMMKPKTNEKFEQMKKLIGTWEGTTKMGDQEQKVIATYELTSGGSAILEKLFAGTPQEMVSVYHADGNTVAMTHFCVGNQPKMTLKNATPTGWNFEMTGKMMKEMHMHALNIQWKSDTSITQEWTSWKDGKKQDPHTFTLTKM